MRTEGRKAQREGGPRGLRALSAQGRARGERRREEGGQRRATASSEALPREASQLRHPHRPHGGGWGGGALHQAGLLASFSQQRMLTLCLSRDDNPPSCHQRVADSLRVTGLGICPQGPSILRPRLSGVPTRQPSPVHGCGSWWLLLRASHQASRVPEPQGHRAALRDTLQQPCGLRAKEAVRGSQFKA